MSERADLTPQPRRRLGLRLPRGATTPGLRRQGLQPSTTPLTEDNKPKRDSEALETPRAYLLKPKASSTNCRRMGLSRHRKDLSKKRLEFVAPTDKIEDAPVSADTIDPQKLEWRQRKILELEADIATWRNGFNAAINDLQTLVTPTIPKETLLTQLRIPLEMLQYLDVD